MAPVLVAMTLGIPAAILTESGLSFLGLGVQPPYATWGNILNDGKDAIEIAWWMTVYPGAGHPDHRALLQPARRGHPRRARPAAAPSRSRREVQRIGRARRPGTGRLGPSARRVDKSRAPRHTLPSLAPKWRNWQTRTFEGRVGQPVGVRVPPSAPIRQGQAAAHQREPARRRPLSRWASQASRSRLQCARSRPQYANRRAAFPCNRRAPARPCGLGSVWG